MSRVRTSFSLTPEVHSMLADLHALLGVSRSTLVNDLLSEALPPMLRMARRSPVYRTHVEGMARLQGDTAAEVDALVQRLQVLLAEQNRDGEGGGS